MTLLYPRDDFEAFLTAVLETWLHRAPEWEIRCETGELPLTTGPQRFVTADPAAALRISDGIQNHAGKDAWLFLGQAFRHRAGGKEALLAGYIRACVRYGQTTLEHLTDGDVRETIDRARAVRAEAHRYLGLLRFEAVAGEGWYAPFEPDHDVLGLLVGPFHQRLRGQNWVLHDWGRRKAWVCREDQGEWVTGVRLPQGWKAGRDDRVSQDLWRQYFRTIAISDRLNPKLQRSKMPQKTWKHLVEKG